MAKRFSDPDGPEDEMRSFQGMVIAFDPKDTVQQYEVLYEDGDSEWLPESSLRPLLTAAGAPAADEAGLAALEEVALEAWRIERDGPEQPQEPEP